MAKKRSGDCATEVEEHITEPGGAPGRKTRSLDCATELNEHLGGEEEHKLWPGAGGAPGRMRAVQKVKKRSADCAPVVMERITAPHRRGANIAPL